MFSRGRAPGARIRDCIGLASAALPEGHGERECCDECGLGAQVTLLWPLAAAPRASRRSGRGRPVRAGNLRISSARTLGATRAMCVMLERSGDCSVGAHIGGEALERAAADDVDGSLRSAHAADGRFRVHSHINETLGTVSARDRCSGLASSTTSGDTGGGFTCTRQPFDDAGCFAAVAGVRRRPPAGEVDSITIQSPGRRLQRVR